MTSTQKQRFFGSKEDVKPYITLHPCIKCRENAGLCRVMQGFCKVSANKKEVCCEH